MRADELSFAVRAHLVQLDIRWEDKGANFERAAGLIEGARAEPGDLVLLPEMFDTGFSMNTGRTADTDGQTLAFLAALARRLGAWVQGGRTVREPSAARARNVMSVLSPGGALVEEFAKVHPFSLGNEQEHFEGGTRVTTYRWGGAVVCPAICYDLRFPELFRRGLAMGAEVFALGACWLEARHAHWRALLVARAIENQAYVLGVNRTGRDPNAAYLGGSVAIGPRGDVLGELDAREGVLSVEIDAGEVRRWREKFPAWRDGRLPGAP